MEVKDFRIFDDKNIERNDVLARILVIEDDFEIRELLRLVLEKAGYHVEVAEDGDEGVALFRNNPTDLVITDIIMPKKEGIETIIELKRDFPDVKIVAISGGRTLGPNQYLEMADVAGAEMTIAKPFDLGDMLDSIKKLLLT